MTARIQWGVTAGIVLAVASGCTDSGDDVADPSHTADATRTVSASVDRAVTVARAVRVSPAAADSILSAHGLSRNGLDALMYEIASDSALARAYAEGIR